MELPLQITFRHMAPSEALTMDIRQKSKKLELFYKHILRCHVVVEEPHLHHRQGKIFHIKIHLTLPDDEIVVNRERALNHAHENPYVAVRDAFTAAKRLLQDYVRHRQRQVKRHEANPEAYVYKLFPMEDYGFLMTPKGEEVYFHKNSVLNHAFKRLDVGNRVRFHPEEGEKGLQASSVELSR